MRRLAVTGAILTIVGITSVGSGAIAAPCVSSNRPWLEVAANVVPASAGKSSTVLSIDSSGCRLRADIGFNPGSDIPAGSGIGAMQLAATDVGRLRTEFNAAQIGFATDCRVYLGCCDIAGFFRITWHGRNGRTNTFRAVEDPNLPLCSSAINQIIFDPAIAEH